MANDIEDRAAALKRKSQGPFTASEQRDALVKQEIEKERAVLAARTARLKALRLAKEAEEKAAAEQREAASPAPAKAKPKSRPRKARASV
jgi:hypothetical protein